ncbi:hypothetical protein LMG23994_02769 [Cupriavidus pinatubonensis]|uniref:Tripartite tricarboxylate transporter family receptor n=2 Tax=Cupriavidus pinatubonensis TaxID=248026 RepID=A0ABM8X2B0_9BURK|nr:hypothetical protein LMG23994_02769 [Cupriavidus pinatubonensis]
MSSRRSPALPEVPTTTELGFPSLLSSTWFAVLAPKGTPNDIVRKMNVAINNVVADPETVKVFTEMGASPLGGTPERVAYVLSADLLKWRAVVKRGNIQMQ